MDAQTSSPTRVRSLQSESDYEAALAEFESYFDGKPKPGSAEGDRFERLGLMIAEYENEHHGLR